MIVSTYLLDSGLFGGFRDENSIPNNMGITSTMYENQFFIGIWNGSEWVEGATPEEIAEANKPIVPQTARSMNFRLVLIQNGISMQSVYDLIDSLPTPQNQLAYQMFEYATHYDRNNAMVNGLAQMMGISQEQLDDFFIQSENLVV